MSKLLKKLKQKKALMKIDNILIKKDTFSKIEEIDGKKVYYTKIFKHLIDFKVTNKEQRLRLVFQEFNNNNNKDYYFFNLFSLEKNDKFLGIKYGWDHLKKPFFLKKEDNKIYAIKKLYYIEFRFKKGSVKSYILSLRTLLRKNEKENTEYYQFTLNHLEKMESKVYKFYNKKSPDGGILKKMDIKKSDIITMASIKGGVGKSVLSILFSYVLKELGKKVLLIDLDPQNSLTSYFNRYISNIEKYNTYSMLKGDFHFNECIKKINDYISIIPSHPILGKFNSEAIDYKEIILEHHLNENMQNYNFDYILLDTPPSLDFLLKNALNVADYIVIPVQVEIWSIESFTILINAVNDITKFRKKIYNISIVENQFIKNRNTIKEVEYLLYKEYREYIKGKIHFSNSIKVLINGRLEPSKKEMYHKEIKDTLKNIFSL